MSDPFPGGTASAPPSDRDRVRDWLVHFLAAKYVVSADRIVETDSVADWGYGAERLADLAGEFNRAIIAYGWSLAAVAPPELKKGPKDGSLGALLDFLSKNVKSAFSAAVDVLAEVGGQFEHFFDITQNPSQAELKTATIACLNPIMPVNEATPASTSIATFVNNGQERVQFVGCINAKYQAKMKSPMSETDLFSRLKDHADFGHLVGYVCYKVWGTFE